MEYRVVLGHSAIVLTPLPGRHLLLIDIRWRGHSLTRNAEVFHGLVGTHHIPVLIEARPGLAMVPQPTAARSLALSHAGCSDKHLTLVLRVLIPVLVLFDDAFEEEGLVQELRSR